MIDDETIRCWDCPHDVDDHDERARCLTLTCSCGWTERHLARRADMHSGQAHPHPATARR